MAGRHQRNLTGAFEKSTTIELLSPASSPYLAGTEAQLRKNGREQRKGLRLHKPVDREHHSIASGETMKGPGAKALVDRGRGQENRSEEKNST